jgi:hypothetical protein
MENLPPITETALALYAEQLLWWKLDLWAPQAMLQQWIWEIFSERAACFGCDGQGTYYRNPVNVCGNWIWSCSECFTRRCGQEHLMEARCVPLVEGKRAQLKVLVPMANLHEIVEFYETDVTGVGVVWSVENSPYTLVNGVHSRAMLRPIHTLLTEMCGRFAEMNWPPMYVERYSSVHEIVRGHVPELVAVGLGNPSKAAGAKKNLIKSEEKWMKRMCNLTKLPQSLCAVVSLYDEHPYLWLQSASEDVGNRRLVTVGTYRRQLRAWKVMDQLGITVKPPSLSTDDENGAVQGAENAAVQVTEKERERDLIQPAAKKAKLTITEATD